MIEWPICPTCGDTPIHRDPCAFTIKGSSEPLFVRDAATGELVPNDPPPS